MGERIPVSLAATISMLSSWTKEDPICLKETTVRIINTKPKNRVTMEIGVTNWRTKSITREVEKAKASIRKGDSDEDLMACMKNLADLDTTKR